MYQEDPEYVIEYPVVSEYAILGFLHPQKKNTDIQKTITEYVDKIANEYSNSLEIQNMLETKESLERYY